jgi:hypothetical protein
MPITLSVEEGGLVVLRGSGVLLRDEVDAMKREVYAHMQSHGKASMLMIIAPDFTNLQAFVKWHDIDVDPFIQRHVIRLAIVGDLRWKDNALIFMLSGAVPFQMEYFPSHQEDFARAWLV